MKALLKVLIRFTAAFGIACSTNSISAQPPNDQARSYSLFLVSGFPTPNYNFGVPITIYRIDMVTRQLTSVLQLSDSDSGCDMILVDYDRRLMVIVSPHDAPSRIDVIDMDSPWTAKPLRFQYDKQFGRLSSHLLDVPGIGPEFGLLLWNGTSEILKGNNFSSSSGVSDLPWKDYQNIRVAGWFGVGQPWPDRIELRRRPDGSVTPGLASVNIGDLEMHLPKDISFSNNATFFLEVNNSEVALVSTSEDQHPAESGIGYRVDHIFQKSTSFGKALECRDL
jgi:hypothetical protein